MAMEGSLTSEQLKDMEVEVYYVLENFIDRYYREHLQIPPTIIIQHFVQLLQLLDGKSRSRSGDRSRVLSLAHFNALKTY
jgi:sulfur transfer complex TusBCD TusB component (DsrH family)